MSQFEEISAQKKTLGDQVVRNSLFGAFQSLISISVLFFVTPYILETIGVERYAVWALVALITSYGRLSEFGLTKALVFFIPKARIEGGIGRINTLVSTAMTFYAIAVSIMMLILLLVRNILIQHVFSIPQYLVDESLFVITGAIFIVGITILSGVFNSVLFGYQRVDIASTILLGYSILDPLGLFLILNLGYGLPGLIISRSISTTIMFGVLIIAAVRVAPGLRYNPRLGNMIEFKKIFNYGINTQIESASWILFLSTPKLLLPQLAGLSTVTYFDLAFRIRLKARTLFLGALSSVTPAASELYAANDRKKLQILYFRSIRYVFLFGLPMFLLMAILSKTFVKVWLGDGFEIVANTIILLAVPAFIGLLYSTSSQLLKGIGQVRPISIVGVATFVTNFILGFFLGFLYGYYGVISSMFFVTIFTTIVLIRICNNHLLVSITDIWKSLSVGAAVLALGLGAISVAYLNFVSDSSDFKNLIVVGLGYVMFYTIGIIVFKLLDNSEVKLVYKFMPDWLPLRSVFKN